MLSPISTPKAYLAVDLFFALSGFVLASSYGPRFEAGLSLAAFMRKRLTRLYPLYAVAIAISGSLMIVKVAAGVMPWSNQMVVVLGLNFVGLPTPMTSDLYPVNVAAWSLFFEVAVNAVMIVLWPSLTKARLIAILVVSGAILMAIAGSEGTLAGGDMWASFGIGLARVCFSFFAGVLLQRLELKLPSIDSNLLAFAFATALLTDISGPIFDLAWVFALSPALIVLAANTNGATILTGLGQYSYAIYILHVPLLRWYTGALGNVAEVGRVPATACYLFIVLIAAYIIENALSASRQTRVNGRPIRA